MSVTPNKVESFVRWQIVEAFTAALELISKANGYNTSPLVTRDRRRVKDAPEQFVVGVDDGTESPLDTRISELEVTVSGWARVKDDDPIRVRSMLLQDIRTAIMADRQTIANSIGTGAAITMGRCETDQGLFLDDGWVVFEQTFYVKYPQGQTW